MRPTAPPHDRNPLTLSVGLRSGPKSKGPLLALALAGAVTLASCGPSSDVTTQPQLACTTPPPALSSALPPVQVFALGTKKVGTRVTFSVPAGAASISIVEQIVSAPATATFTDLGKLPNGAAPRNVTDPSGAVIFDPFHPPADPTQAQLYFGSLSPGTGTLTLPDTSAGLTWVASGLPAGTWSFVVSDLAHLCTLAANCASGGGSSAGTYAVTVIVKSSAGAVGNIPATGQVDVTFNLTPGGINLSAATASSDLDLKRMLSSLGTLLARAGLTLGTVTYVDVPAAAAAKVASGVDVDDRTVCGELPQLLATAPAGRQVNIFLVPNFISSGLPPGTLVAGFDGTIPGPATLSPTLQGGAAVSVADLRAGTCGATLALASCGADVVAYVTAHEMGHFLGLYHVTERNGTVFDPLGDTPTCKCQTCASVPSQCADATPAPATPHTMGVTECEHTGTSCDGGDNLMFWLLGDGSVGKLSTEQGRVMRANPAVY